MFADINEIAKRVNGNSLCVGYTSGVFDLFHHGHTNYLCACKANCEYLVVGVDLDHVVKSNKGEARPIENDRTRVNSVLATGFVDAVFLKDKSAEQLLPVLRPNKYFVPSNRILTDKRLKLLGQLSIQLVVIAYTIGISTTDLAKELDQDGSTR